MNIRKRGKGYQVNKMINGKIYSFTLYHKPTEEECDEIVKMMAEQYINTNIFNIGFVVYQDISKISGLDFVLSENGYVYIVEINDSMVKIGCSSRPDKRLLVLNNSYLQSYGEVKRFAISLPCDNRYMLENKLHRIFGKYRIPDTEIFNISFDDICKRIRILNI